MSHGSLTLRCTASYVYLACFQCAFVHLRPPFLCSYRCLRVSMCDFSVCLYSSLFVPGPRLHYQQSALLGSSFLMQLP